MLRQMDHAQLIGVWCTFRSDSKLAVTRAGAVALQELLVCALLLVIFGGNALPRAPALSALLVSRAVLDIPMVVPIAIMRPIAMHRIFQYVQEVLALFNGGQERPSALCGDVST